MTDKEKAILWFKSFVKNKEPMTLIPKQLIRLMYDALNEQPEVIRCKDCKKRDSVNCWMYFWGKTTSDDWFCADGEAKDDG